MRVVLDTNIVVSAYLSPKGTPASIRALWIDRVLDVVVSVELLAEYERVLAYDRIARLHGMDSAQINEEVRSFRQFGIVVTLPSEIPNAIPEDPADNIVIATALAGSAPYIISGDDDLLRLGQFKGIQVLRPAAFLKALG
jgi:putative PIN family toxin of toxin-antitoxin system